MKKNDALARMIRYERQVKALMVFVVLVKLTLLGLAIYVAAHFIGKYW